MAADPDLPARGAPFSPRLLAGVAVGGVVGSLLRYALGRAFPTAAGTFPATTLAINLTGALLLGALVAVLAPRHDPLWRVTLGTGVLGGYTTFSTFAVDADRLVSTHHAATAAAYVVASLAGGVAAAILGRVVASTAVAARTAGP